MLTQRPSSRRRALLLQESSPAPAGGGRHLREGTDVDDKPKPSSRYRNVPDRDAAQLWRELPLPIRKAIIKQAKRGAAWPDEQQALRALGWAWSVLGDPRGGKRHLRLRIAVFTAFALIGGGTHQHQYSGAPYHNDNPVTIRAALAVERANRSYWRPTSE